MTFKDRKRKKELIGKAMDYISRPTPTSTSPAYPYNKNKKQGKKK